MIPMIPDVIEYVYAAGWAFSIRPLAGHFAWRYPNKIYKTQDKPDNTDWCYASVQAFFVGAIWPTGILYTKPFRKVKEKISNVYPVIGEEKKALEEQNKERLKQLAKDLELDDPFS